MSHLPAIFLRFLSPVSTLRSLFRRCAQRVINLARHRAGTVPTSTDVLAWAFRTRKS